MLLQIPGLRPFHLLRLLLVLLGISASLLSARAEEFLPPNQAFALTARWLDAHTLRLHWAIAPGYKLYRARIDVESGEPQATVLGAWQLPPGKPSFDLPVQNLPQQAVPGDLVPLRSGNAPYDPAGAASANAARAAK